MKRLFNFLLAGTLMFSPYSFSGEDKQSNEPKILESKELLTQERPVEIVGEAIKTKEVKKRDLVNLIARIDDEEIRDRSEYAEGQFMEAYMKALEEDLNDDPLSMLGNNMKKMISSLKIK
jgi:predicted polyphosphate/ATP-dependent NAD kinase